MKDEVAATALKLFVERGFDSVTTTQIAAAAGISPRSFFRYFPTKEDVLLSGLHEAGQRVLDALRMRPQGEVAWKSLGAAFRVLIDAPAFQGADIAAVAKVILDSPSIQARSAEKRRDWDKLLVPEIARRLAPTRPGALALDDRAAAILGAALACVEVTTRVWLRSGGTIDPVLLLDEAMSEVHSST
ncbi:MAG: HTH-type transcriptional regulator betI [Subtercola sp.]|nr:HTH-type transcriptional regulator betI [Subtercola sp.]